MAKSWSGLRKELEENFLCKSLRGRIQYFVTNYHKAPDNYGRVAIRVDGKEVLMGNPYDYYVKGYSKEEDRLKDEMEIPPREWIGKETFYEKENKKIENTVYEKAINDGVFDVYDFISATHKYKNSDINKSIDSPNPLIRMLAIMDRRVGKRTLIKLKLEVYKQPEWLQFFYNLRFEAEDLL